jgi:surfactin synthase thioesterase subunit
MSVAPASPPPGAAVASALRFATVTRPTWRLFCLPFAGGGAAGYRTWHRTLPDDVDVVALQLPGRDAHRRVRPLDRIADMVQAARPVLEAEADLPYAIFGHSMGALVAYELTVALERDGHSTPSHLFVSARRPPDEPHDAAPIHGLPDEQFLDELQGRYGGVPEVVRREPDLLALLLPVLRADVAAIETYTPLTDRRVACPVRVYGGAADRHPRPEQLPGWQRFADHDVSVQLFPGDHFYVATQQAALTADLAARFAAVLAPVEQR